MPNSPDVLIIGAGLSGLVSAVRVHQRSEAVVRVWEARDRIGGRTWSPSVGPEALRLDLGAAWHWEPHERVHALTDELGLERIRQHEPGIAVYEARSSDPPERFEWPETPPPSWRIDGGTQALCHALVRRLPDEGVTLRHRVTRIERTTTGVRVEADTPEGLQTVTVGTVIVALPPRLVAATLPIEPSLPDAVTEAQRRLPTWMGNSGKAAATFSSPFWRERGLAGRVVSHAGPVAHWHDAVAPDGRAALVGFLHSTGQQTLETEGADAVRAALRAQLTHCFGKDAPPPTSIVLSNWRTDPATTPPAAPPLSTETPPTPPAVLTDPHWNGRLLWAGAETARDHPGYLDGAIEAGERAARHARA